MSAGGAAPSTMDFEPSDNACEQRPFAPVDSYDDREAVAPRARPAPVPLDSAKPFPFTRASEFEPPTDLDYVIKNIIHRGRHITPVGPPASGKSTLVMSMACAVASGEDAWFGHRVRGGAVLWLALEGQSGLGARLEAHRRRGLLAADAALYVVTAPVRLLIDANAIIATAAAVAEQATQPVVLIVIDTLSRALAGLNENDSETMTAAVAAIDRLRAATGAAVMMVHHLGKDGERGARGHSALNGGHDVQFDVTRSGTSDDRKMVIRKNRDGAEGLEITFRLDVIEIGRDSDGDPITACVAVPSEGSVEAPKAGGKIQKLALGAMRDWCRTNSGTHIASNDLKDLLEAHGAEDRRRRSDAVAYLTSAGVLSPSVGGHAVRREALS